MRRECYGPSLLWAEMSRNRGELSWGEMSLIRIVRNSSWVVTFDGTAPAKTSDIKLELSENLTIPPL